MLPLFEGGVWEGPPLLGELPLFGGGVWEGPLELPLVGGAEELDEEDELDGVAYPPPSEEVTPGRTVKGVTPAAASAAALVAKLIPTGSCPT